MYGVRIRIVTGDTSKWQIHQDLWSGKLASFKEISVEWPVSKWIAPYVHIHEFIDGFASKGSVANVLKDFYRALKCV